MPLTLGPIGDAEKRSVLGSCPVPLSEPRRGAPGCLLRITYSIPTGAVTSGLAFFWLRLRPKEVPGGDWRSKKSDSPPQGVKPPN